MTTAQKPPPLLVVYHFFSNIENDDLNSSYNTRREQDIEFATDPNFFELIFNVLTIVGTLKLPHGKTMIISGSEIFIKWLSSTENESIYSCFLIELLPIQTFFDCWAQHIKG